MRSAGQIEHTIVLNISKLNYLNLNACICVWIFAASPTLGIEKRDVQPFRSQAPEISYARYRIRRTHLRRESMQSHVYAQCSSRILSLPYLFLFSIRLSLLLPEIPISSSRPLVSRSLRYLRTLRSRTHVVVRMHTRAYIRRVLRKLAPYASIQISHLATYVPTLSDLLKRSPSLTPFHSSLCRFRPLQSNGSLSLSNSHMPCIVLNCEMRMKFYTETKEMKI